MSANTTTLKEYSSESSGSILVAISISFIVLTTLALILRHHARQFSSYPLGPDDALVAAAYLANLGMCIVAIASVYLGAVGHHAKYIAKYHPVGLRIWAQCIFAFEITYFAAIGLPKMAIVVLYLRLLAWKGHMRVAAYVLIAVLGATEIALVVSACFQCRPLAYWWDRSIEGGRCFDVQSFFRAQAIPGIVLDAIVILFPLKTVWSLRLPAMKRSALVFMFMVAGFGIVTAIIRAKTFYRTEALTDRTWVSVELLGWSIIELSTYIITACLPHTRPLFSNYTPQSVKDAVQRAVNAATWLSRSHSGHVHQGNSAKQSVSLGDAVPLTQLSGVREGKKDGDVEFIDSTYMFREHKWQRMREESKEMQRNVIQPTTAVGPEMSGCGNESGEKM